jgi:methionyl-tRNA formyltransferase
MSNSNSNQNLSKIKLGFFGTPAHSAYLLRRLCEARFDVSFVVTNPDKPSGRGKQLTSSPVKQVALEKNIPIFQPPNLKQEEFVQPILDYSVDLGIVFAYGALIPRVLFDAPTGGTINLHGSLLPEFRGASPVQAAILSGKKETGFSLQYITEELDAGDVISFGKVAIDDYDNFGTLLDKITYAGTEEILRLLSTYSGNKFQAFSQDHSLATRCKKIKPEDRKLDFSQNAQDLHNKIRAFNPGNICFCEFRGKRMNLYKTRIAPGQTQISPGTLVLLDRKTIGVSTGDFKILILDEVQPENKKVMSGTDFLNGSRLEEGEKFL